MHQNNNLFFKFATMVPLLTKKINMTVKIGFLNETNTTGEKRVSLPPICTDRLIKSGIKITMETGAGKMAGFADNLYKNTDIKKTSKEVLKSVDVLVKLNPPTTDEIKSLKNNAVIISVLLDNKEALILATNKKIKFFALEKMPRITRAQSMDILSSQATVAGYSAVIKAALSSSLLFPMMTTAAGTITPAKVVVIGAGVAGLQAIATAHRLGARVLGYDIRPDAKEQIESLGAKMIDSGVSAEGQGGYARELTEDEKQQQQQKLTKELNSADVIITTAAIPGKKAPTIITKKMLDDMSPHCVIVDLAVESGGNCEVSDSKKEMINKNGVKVIGLANASSFAATDASLMFGKNIENFLALLIDEGKIKVDTNDEIIKTTLQEV
jgi:H+-translocating NAD(P) transhydrogenase subunit alpha